MTIIPSLISANPDDSQIFDRSLTTFLRDMRFSKQNLKITKTRTKCNVQPGVPITTSTYHETDDPIPATSGVTKNKSANRKHNHVDSDVDSDVPDRAKSGKMP